MWIFHKLTVLFEKIYKIPDIESAWWERMTVGQRWNCLVLFETDPLQAYKEVKPYILPHFKKGRLGFFNRYSFYNCNKRAVSSISFKQVRILRPSEKAHRYGIVRLQQKHQIWNNYNDGFLVHIKSPREEEIASRLICDFLRFPHNYFAKMALGTCMSAEGIEVMLSWFSLKYMEDTKILINGRTTKT